MDRPHPYRRTRTQYTIEILHVPPNYPLNELEKELKERWGYSIDSTKRFAPGRQTTCIYYINFSREKEALDCVNFLKTSDKMTPEMWINEKIRELDPSNDLNIPTSGRGRGRERRGRGRGLNRNYDHLDIEPYGGDYNLEIVNPPQLDDVKFSPPTFTDKYMPFPYPKQEKFPPSNQEYNDHFPSQKQENIPFSPKYEYNPPTLLPSLETETSTRNMRENNPLTPKFERSRAPKPEKSEFSETIIHIGNIPSFVDKPILNDLLLSKQIEGVIDTKIREDATDPSVNEALIYLDDESAMEDIISKLNHVKVASKPFKAKQHKKETPKETPKETFKETPKETRKEIDPQEYISSELPRYEKNEQFPFPPTPSQNVNQAPRRVSRSEDLAEKSIKMSIQLYDFAKTKYRAQMEAFTFENGIIHHQSDTLIMKSSNLNSLKTLHSTINEVSEEKQTYGEDDYSFLVETHGSNQQNLVDEKAHLFMTAGQIRYYLNSSVFSLHVFGIRNCVDVVVKNIQEALYYQFVVKNPMDIYISVFPGLIPETIGNKGILKESKVLIASKIGIQECKSIRDKLKQLQNSLVCEPCNTFPLELITSGLKFCKENNLRVAIIFRCSDGLLYKKFKPESILTLCGNNEQVLSTKQVFSKPICCELPATKNGLALVRQATARNLPLSKYLEQEFTVLIQLCKNSVKLQGFIQRDLDKACDRIRSKLDNVEIFLSQMLAEYQIAFLLEAVKNGIGWILDMMSELELNYDVQLVQTANKRDFKFQGNQEAFQKIENEKHQITALFKDIIIHICDPILVDKSSCDSISKLLEGFIEQLLKNEDVYICYGWDFKDSQSKSNRLDMHIQLVGARDSVNLIASKIIAIKPESGKLRDRYNQKEVEQVDQIGPILRNIEVTEFICFNMTNQRPEYHSLGISSQKPWEIFDGIMSDQMVVRTIQIKLEILYFLRSKKLLKGCETELHCSIVEEHQERRPTRQGQGQGQGDRRRQYDGNVLVVKGKNADVKTAMDKLKKWIDNFTCKSIALIASSKITHFFASELESLKSVLESREVLILDIREAKNKLWRKKDIEGEEEIPFTVRVEALDDESCASFAKIIEEKLKIVESEEFDLSDRQLSILMSALKDQKIPKNEHYYVAVEFKQRRTGSAKIIAIKHFEAALEKGIATTSPYLQFKDQMYNPPKFIQEILFHHQKYTSCMNVNAKTLGIEFSRPNTGSGSYKFSGNKGSIQKMIFNLKNFEIGFIRLCDKKEFEINLPLDELKKDGRYKTLENDLAKTCNVKIFSFGCLPSDIENEVKKCFGDFQYFSDDSPFFEQDDSPNNTLGTYTFGNTTIQVIKGDITKLTVACIINGANDQLDHSIGLAKAISDAGGPSIQKGCHNYVQESGRLGVGGAVLQGGGNLPCTKIIHVSCPHWGARSGQKKSTGDLSSCIQTVFNLCETHKLTSIAIPSVSTGVFGFPTEISTHTIVRECKLYIENNVGTCIQRILLIDRNAAIVSSFYKDCQRAFGLNPRSQYLSEDLDFSESIYGATLVSPVQETLSKPPTIEFLWQENDNQYYPYAAKQQSLLLTAYQTNPQGQATFKRGEYTYTVKFNSLEQVNDSTQAKRKIKINTEVDPESIPLPKPPLDPGFNDFDTDDSGIHFPWYFLNEFNSWVHYQNDVAKKISDAYLNNPKGSATVEINSYTYIIDFNTMVQTNQTTNTTRNVKVDKNRLDAAMDHLANASGEKVILYGLRENLIRAQVKFDNFVQTKISYKEVDIHGLPKTVMIPTIMKLKKKYSYLKVEIKDRGEDYCIKLNGVEKEVQLVHDELKDHYIKFLEQVTRQEQTSGFSLPKEWKQHAANEMVHLVPLVNGCPEWIKVSTQFNSTSARPIVYIDRIQNKWLWRKYQQTKDSFKELKQNPNELTVFHGTSGTDPDLICKGAEGFDFRHSSKGMWGKANYFAVNASFCEIYQYTDPATQLRKIFMVKLLAGNVAHLHSDSSLTMPPLLPKGNSNFVGQRYDTVSGDHSAGSKIYMLYTNERTYPEYLVTYS